MSGIRRVLLADDHAVVRQGLTSLLEMNGTLQVVGEAGCAEELLELLVVSNAELLITDISMPGAQGIDLIVKVRTLFPAIPVLVLSMYSDPSIVQSVLKAGCAGFICKTCEPSILVSAVHSCINGGSFVDPGLVADLVSMLTTGKETHLHDCLSPRESQVMLMLASGLTINAIADKLFVSPKTVSTHKFRIMQKLGLNSIAELVRYAINNRLVDL